MKTQCTKKINMGSVSGTQEIQIRKNVDAKGNNGEPGLRRRSAMTPAT
jgi:hypothetical protein